MERTFVLKIDTVNQDWRRNLDIHLGQVANELDASIQIYELNETGIEKANQILIAGLNKRTKK